MNSEAPRTTIVANLHHSVVSDERRRVYVGRRGHGYDGYFGNPFHTENRNRYEAIRMFSDYFNHRVKTDKAFHDRVVELRGCVLECFCVPKICHAQVIANWIDQHPIDCSCFPSI